MQRALAWLKGVEESQSAVELKKVVDHRQPDAAQEGVGSSAHEGHQGLRKWSLGVSENMGQPVILPVEAIVPNPFQPRQYFSDQEMDALTASVRRVGVLQPVIVRPAGRKFQLIMGERRWRAAGAAGLKEVPALVRDLDDETAAVLALVENVQRTDLNFWEEAEGYKTILDRFGATQAELALAVGKQQSTIANKLRLLRLPDDVKLAARQAGFTERHVRALLRLEDSEDLREVVGIIAQEKLTVRETEALIDAWLEEQAIGLPAVGAGSEAGVKEQAQRPRGGLRMIRDARILLNTFRQGVDALRKAGLDASMDTADEGDHFTVTIRIPKERQG